MPETNLAQLGYEHYYQMLSDKIRMEAYKKAIFASVKKGDIVIDLGAGTGLLSVWAVKAGAAKVYAIEKTEAIQLAKEIAKVNGCLDKIEFIQENSMQVCLDEKADVLVSETLGSFAIDENTLEFTLDIRQRLLKDNAILIPQSIDLYVAAIDNKDIYHKIDFWRQIPEINFSPAFELFSKKILVEQVTTKNLLTDATPISHIDLREMSHSNFQANLYLPIVKAGMIHGVVGWFKVMLTDSISINTSPKAPLTHWKQAFFPFQQPIPVIAGDVLDWKMSLASKSKDSDDCLISYQYRCTQLINEAQNMPSSPASKPNRNTLCPCGSGKKYKKCCIN